MASLTASRPLLARRQHAPRSAGRRCLVPHAAGERWGAMQTALKQAAVKTVSVEEVAGLQAAGYTLLDVRPAEEFEESHPPGAVSVPLFGPIKVDSPSKLLKQLMYSANGMKGTDENVNFVEEATAAVKDTSRVLVICDAGGTYMPVGVTLEGRRSRSLVAIFKLLSSKLFTDVRHVKGGIREWGESELPLEGSSPDAWRSKSGLTPR